MIYNKIENFTTYEDFEYSDKLSIENIKQLKIGQKKMSNMLIEFDRICRKFGVQWRKVLPKHLRFSHECRVDGTNNCAFHYDKYLELYNNNNNNNNKNI